jgi:hypothetical protein
LASSISIGLENVWRWFVLDSRRRRSAGAGSSENSDGPPQGLGLNLGKGRKNTVEKPVFCAGWVTTKYRTNSGVRLVLPNSFICTAPGSSGEHRERRAADKLIFNIYFISNKRSLSVNAAVR